ncbi:MAG: hypothetical protein LBN24_12475, partial [Mediterranea sp.]|nr:hypothetical protein [Mediterranea sp.]
NLIYSVLRKNSEGMRVKQEKNSRRGAGEDEAYQYSNAMRSTFAQYELKKHGHERISSRPCLYQFTAVFVSVHGRVFSIHAT